MSRSIKFRAWFPETKVMILFDDYGFCYEYGSLSWYTQQDPYDGVAECPKDYSKAIVMQWTGLKDKNNNDIYEGDIVKVDWNDTRYQPQIGVVIWNVSEAKFDFSYGATSEVNWSHEVIGNIHQNPELISK